MKWFIISIVLAVVMNPAAAQTDTTFTYQGRLNEQSVPANGTFDMDFSLWDALSQGRKVLPSVILNGVVVSDGLFTVELDFGASAFDNNGRWIEIEVNGSTLSPRQPVTRAPYSIQTRGIFVDANHDVGIGTTDPAVTLHVEGPILSGGPNGGDVTARNPNNATAGVGLGWHNDVPRIRIGGEGDGTSSGFDIQTVNDRSLLRILNNGNVGIGTTSPLFRLHIETDDENTAIYGLSPTNGVRGLATNTSGFASGVYGQTASTQGPGVYGIATAPSGVNYGVFGRSDSPSGYDFYANGAGINYGAPSSIRWKRDIEPVTDPLGMLAQIRAVYYDWDEDHGGNRDIGFIGEEVGKVLPEIVNYEEDGEYVTGMDYGRMTPLLVEAVNALRAEKDEQLKELRTEKDAQIGALEQRIGELESLVEQLAARTSKTSG